LASGGGGGDGLGGQVLGARPRRRRALLAGARTEQRDAVAQALVLVGELAGLVLGLAELIAQGHDLGGEVRLDLEGGDRGLVGVKLRLEFGLLGGELVHRRPEIRILILDDGEAAERGGELVLHVGQLRTGVRGRAGGRRGRRGRLGLGRLQLAPQVGGVGGRLGRVRLGGGKIGLELVRLLPGRGQLVGQLPVVRAERGRILGGGGRGRRRGRGIICPEGAGDG
jgi:hypothetical protein